MLRLQSRVLNRNSLVDAAAPSILVRSRKTPSILTGLRVVDVLFPVAKGQRELIIGDRQSGKSTVWICSQISQVVTNAFVVKRRVLISTVSAVGSRLSSGVRIMRLLTRCEARSDICFLLSGVTDPMGAQYIGHLTATAVAENSRNRGAHHQAAYDDLSKHAVAYRQMCLFLRKPAGREAYPSDVFYLHARLLERSCNLGKWGAGGSLMSLPVIETLNNDLSAYIATNVISITDGQLYLDLSLFGVGQCPAVSTEKSVSRVGAKSLDSVSRSSAFALYSLVAEVKQESEVAVKSEGFAIRFARFQKFLFILVQRSSQAKIISTQLLFGVHAGLCEVLPVSSLGVLFLSLSFVSLRMINSCRFLADKTWNWMSQTCIELTGAEHKYFRTHVESLRLIISVAFILASSLTGIYSAFKNVVNHITLTLNAATSFIVDITAKDNSHADNSQLLQEIPAYQPSFVRQHRVCLRLNPRFDHHSYHVEDQRHLRSSV